MDFYFLCGPLLMILGITNYEESVNNYEGSIMLDYPIQWPENVLIGFFLPSVVNYTSMWHARKLRRHNK